MSSPELRVLGPTHLRIDGRDVSLPRGRAAVLAALAFTRGSLLSPSQLCELIWNDPPSRALKALQNQVSRIRSTYGESLIETINGTYQLGADVALVDVDEIATCASKIDRETDVGTILGVLKSFRGPAFSELVGSADVRARRSQLTETRLDLIERVAALGSTEIATELASPSVADGDLDPIRHKRLVRLLAKPTDVESQNPNQRPVVLSRDQESIAHAIEVAARPGLDGPSHRALILAGSAGSGKTTIADCVATELDSATDVPATVMRGACSQSPAEAHELIAALLEQLPPAAELDANLGPVDRLVEASKTLDSALVMIVDDCHWATLAFFDLVDKLAREAPHVVLVLSTRDASVLDGALSMYECATFEAPELDQTAVELLLRATASEQCVTSNVAAKIHGITAGAPLFTSELIRELDASDAFAVEDGVLGLRPGHEVPQTLVEAVALQLDAMPLRSRHMIEMVATLHLIGGPVTTSTIKHPDPAASNGIDLRLLRLEPDGRWVMHAEVALAVLNSLSEGKRAELHAHATDLLRSRWPVAAARHAARASTLPRSILREIVDEAAEHAYNLSDFGSALEMWDLGDDFELTNSLATSQQVDLAVKRCEAARRVGDPRQADYMVDLVGLASKFADPAQMAAVARIICRLGATTGVAPRADFVEFAERTLTLDLEFADRASVLSATTQLYALTDIGRARRRFDEAYQIVMDLDDSELTRFVLPAAHVTVVGPNDLDHRTHIGELLLRQSRADDDPSAEWEARHLLASCALLRGDGANLAHHTDAAAALPPARYELLRAGTVAYMRAAERHLAGDLVAAEREAEKHLELSHTVGAQRALATYGVLLAVIRYDQGRLDELLPAIEDLQAQQPHLVGWKGPLAWIAAESGDRERGSNLVAETVGGDLHGLPLDMTHSAVLWCYGAAAALGGDPELCAAMATMLAPYEGTMSWAASCSFGPMDLVLGRLAAVAGEHDRARAYFSKVATLGNHNEWPATEMRAQLALAELDIDEAQSQQLLRSVFARATQLGLDGIAQHARDVQGG